jgi:hypothetical protein
VPESPKRKRGNLPASLSHRKFIRTLALSLVFRPSSGVLRPRSTAVVVNCRPS